MDSLNVILGRSHDVTHDPGIREVPPEWRALLAGGPGALGDLVAEAIELHEPSRARELLCASHDAAFVASKGASRRGDRGAWELAIALCYDGILFFAPPDRRPCGIRRPSGYECLCRHVGIPRFGLHGGMLIGPGGLGPLEAVRIAEGAAVEAVPFYSWGNGDYDCWRDGDFEVTWHYDHETSRLTIGTPGAFAGWFETRLLAHLKLAPPP